MTNKYIEDAENAIAKVWEAGYREGLRVGREEKSSKTDANIPNTIYLAKDKDGSLWLYGSRPERRAETFIGSSLETCARLVDTVIGDNVTWENSSIEYQRIIKNNEE